MTTLYAGTQCYQMFYSSLLHDVLLQTFVRALIRRIKLRLNSRHRRYFLLLAEWIFKLAFVVFSSIFTSLGLFVLISTFISCWSFHSRAEIQDFTNPSISVSLFNTVFDAIMTLRKRGSLLTSFPSSNTRSTFALYFSFWEFSVLWGQRIEGRGGGSMMLAFLMRVHWPQFPPWFVLARSFPSLTHTSLIVSFFLLLCPFLVPPSHSTDRGIFNQFFCLHRIIFFLGTELWSVQY